MDYGLWVMMFDDTVLNKTYDGYNHNLDPTHIYYYDEQLRYYKNVMLEFPQVQSVKQLNKYLGWNYIENNKRRNVHHEYFQHD